MAKIQIFFLAISCKLRTVVLMYLKAYRPLSLIKNKFPNIRPKLGLRKT
jgi:hypothetical protein